AAEEDVAVGGFGDDSGIGGRASGERDEAGDAVLDGQGRTGAIAQIGGGTGNGERTSANTGGENEIVAVAGERTGSEIGAVGIDGYRIAQRDVAGEIRGDIAGGKGDVLIEADIAAAVGGDEA